MNQGVWVFKTIGYYFHLISSKSEEKQTNMRRENKLYSYQEQMADIELKKVRRISL